MTTIRLLSKTHSPYLFILLMMVTVQCQSADEGSVSGDLSPCIFENPLGVGQDPWVTRYEGSYYYIETANDGAIYVSGSDDLTTVMDNRQQVWQQPDTGWNRATLWAPELHFLSGKWYIYYTAGESGPPFTSQRSGVLESAGTDPMGPYTDRGMLYTGDNIDAGENEIWAIDLTPLMLNGQLYGIWSGWEENVDDDGTPQHLYIAEMENPWTVSSNRVKISSPEESWETGGELDLNEGAQVLRNESGDLFLVYSTRESWLPTYRLGLLKLDGSDADPMNPNSWIKTGPVFMGTDQVLGTGHSSFTTSPDGTEDWIVYHTKADTIPGWNRVVHAQPFSWGEAGMPQFGTPLAAGVELARPSGECSN